MSDLTQINKLLFVLDAVVPPSVAVAADQAAEQPEPFEYIEEGQHLANAVLARRNEFIAGRRCARAALAEIGYASCALPVGTGREPIWPKGIVGSISHSLGLCCAVVASCDDVLSIGVDLEKTTRLSSHAVKHVLHPLEADFCGTDQALGSVLFSVKEAFFKAQFPIWGARPNFKDLALKMDVSSQQMSVLEVAQHLPKELYEATLRMQFRYELFDDYVVTLCCLNET